jgi:hypothetical protein
MKNLLVAALIVPVALLGATRPAKAGDRAAAILTGVAVGIGAALVLDAIAPRPVVAAPVVYQPPPVVYAPAPVVVQTPPPVIVTAPPVVYQTPVVYQPAPVIVRAPRHVAYPPHPAYRGGPHGTWHWKGGHGYRRHHDDD